MTNMIVKIEALEKPVQGDIKQCLQKRKKTCTYIGFDSNNTSRSAKRRPPKILQDHLQPDISE